MQADIPERKYPAHHPPIERWNQSVIVFLTVCTAERRPVLANAVMHDRLRAAWKTATHWRVGHYVIMPDHVHLFCSPALREAESIKKWMAYWKRNVTRNAAMAHHLWQRDGWDVQIRSGADYDEKLAYVLQNPIRAGLVGTPEEWPFQGVMHALRL